MTDPGPRPTEESMTTDETLNTLQADLAALLGEAPDVELREFATKAEFAAYAQSELVKASGEADPEERVARLKHLSENVRHVNTLKFEDTGAKALPVYAGKLSVQAQTAWRERSTQDITVAQAAASQAPGPKGYAQKGHAETLLATLNDLLSKEGDAGDAASEGEGTAADAESGASEGEGTGTEEEEEGAKGDDVVAEDANTTPSAKAMKDPWGTGMDMNMRDPNDPDEYGNTSLRAF